jgi:hypothetical protein
MLPNYNGNPCRLFILESAYDRLAMSEFRSIVTRSHFTSEGVAPNAIFDVVERRKGAIDSSIINGLLFRGCIDYQVSTSLL